MSVTLSTVAAAGLICAFTAGNSCEIDLQAEPVLTGPVICQQYGGADPHGLDPHGPDPHDEVNDPDLPANAREEERKAPDNVYDDVYNEQTPDTSLPPRK